MFATTQQVFLSALAATTFFFATPSSAAAVAVQPRQGPGPVNDWITIDSNGNARTISPSVVTSNGARTTISPPPYSLTGTVFTVTATNGALTTSTGVPPPPTASNTMGYGGVFSVCNNKIGEDGPFCQPRRGSTLHVETTYYITWDTTFFAEASTPIGIIGFDVDNGVTDSAPAFSITNISGGNGWVQWTPRFTSLEDKEANNMTIVIMYEDPDTGEEKSLPGPVFTLRAALSNDGTTNSRPNLLAILLPVILISLAIAAVMFWLYIRRRRRHAAAAAALKQPAGEPASSPIRAKHAQKGSADIQLEPTSPPTSPPPGSPPGTNVFQEEMRRQARERA
ncbi:hypothetical protein EsH8_I_000148 [Colletotrichum jinshuiense]